MVDGSMVSGFTTISNEKTLIIQMKDFITEFTENAHIFKVGKSKNAAAAKERDHVAEIC